MTKFPAGNSDASGYLAIPENGHGPGVLVLHAWWGLNDFFKGLCDRLAKEGFVALAPDLYAGKVASTVKEAEALMQASDFEAMKAAALGAIEFLGSHPAVTGPGLGAIGFSMGGSWAILLSSLKPEILKAVVIFYGIGEADYKTTRAVYLGHFSDQDEWEPLEGVRQMEADMRAAGREVTIHIYPGMKHWFFEANRLEHDPQAAELAWQRTLDFLREHLRT
jgi:carboxymethylenebutenolidase